MAGILVTLTRAAALVLTLALVPPVLGAEDAPLEAPDSGEGNGDYLAPLLREAVEDLKAELATSTSRGNAQARARTAWDWINAACSSLMAPSAAAATDSPTCCNTTPCILAWRRRRRTG